MGHVLIFGCGFGFGTNRSSASCLPTYLSNSHCAAPYKCVLVSRRTGSLSRFCNAALRHCLILYLTFRVDCAKVCFDVLELDAYIPFRHQVTHLLNSRRWFCHCHSSVISRLSAMQYPLLPENHWIFDSWMDCTPVCFEVLGLSGTFSF